MSLAEIPVKINGEPRSIPASLTVTDLIAHLGLSGGPVAVEVNREIIPRADHAKKKIQARDEIEIVHFVGGG
jgi:thiamine biosynthesis protein ThiS